MTQDIAARARILIRRPSAAVYAAFADPAQMTRFWFPRASGPLKPGAAVTWFLAAEDGAPGIDVRVRAAEEGQRLRFDWGMEGQFTAVDFRFTAQGPGTTLLEVAETGFTGTPEQVLARALDSTGGFNQVVVAAKAWLEHGAAVNVVTDHAPARAAP